MADLVVFGEDWGGLPSSTQHLMKQLAEDHRILWVNSIGMRSPKLTCYDIKRTYNKCVNALTSKKYASQSTELFPYVIHPQVLPFHGSKWARKINRTLLKKQLMAIIKHLDFKDVILWISVPTAVEVVGCLDEMAVVYYCGDDFSGLSGVDHNVVEQLEKDLVNKADMVLVSSKKLLKKINNKKAVLLSHGVDYRMFSTPKKRPYDLPDIGPIAGFYGSISDWIDIEMIAQSAMALPSWYFVFIGDIKTDVSILQNLPNVIFLNHKQHIELAAYVQHWDVAMLPFKNNQQIKSCNPLKLREYLASGTSVVSTYFPEVEEYSDTIAIQKKGEHFFQAIQRAYGLKEQKLQRQQLVEHESWGNKALDLVKLFDYLQKKAKLHIDY
jgi:glycosyltransferase involved in cell wall biosynthesis